MKINKDSLRDRANNLAKQYNISSQMIYYRFFFDSFLTRLSKSKYRDSFILKGGLYLSSLIGINSRSTIDIDFNVKRVKLEKDIILTIVKEVCALDTQDDVIMLANAIERIKETDNYGGYRIKITGNLSNIKCVFFIDIATGDPIIPSEIKYRYSCLLTGKYINLKASSIETVLAEKIQTILSRGITNSRSKDFYDLYILSTTHLNEIDAAVFKKAYMETCKYRGFDTSKKEALRLLDMLIDSAQINLRWNAYCRQVGYAEGIDFKTVIKAIKKLIILIFR